MKEPSINHFQSREIAVKPIAEQKLQIAMVLPAPRIVKKTF